MREAQIKRKTNETDITLSLNLDGSGKGTIDTGCGFFDHMLTLFSRHARFDMDVKCNGDVQVDYHHTVEDVGIALGDAFKNAIGDMKGITRYGSTILPMDETLILSAVDISGRSFLVCDLPTQSPSVGDFDCELVKEFFTAFSRHANVTLHVKEIYGENTHHVLEGAFKSVARSLATAVKINPDYKDEIPSTKGVL